MTCYAVEPHFEVHHVRRKGRDVAAQVKPRGAGMTESQRGDKGRVGVG